MKRKYIFICPNCGLKFKPNLWTRLWAFKAGEDLVYLKCPRCKKSIWMKRRDP